VIGPGVSHAHAVSTVIGIVAEESALSPAERLIDKLWGSQEPLSAQERHDVATLLYALQRACGPLDPGAMVRKAIRLDGLMETWADVFGEQS
jgi:hypothetical protein